MPKNGGTGKERTRYFPVSFSFLAWHISSSQLALYNQQQSTTLNVEHSSPVIHATKATAHTARPWPQTTMICNGHAATDPQYRYPYPYYAHTIYVPPTYPWSVSTRLVLAWLPVPSPSTTEDQNAFALQLFSECHLLLRSPMVLPFCFPLHVVVLPPAEHTGFSSMILPNHCLLMPSQQTDVVHMVSRQSLSLLAED